MICPKCGAENKGKFKFCVTCGSNLNDPSKLNIEQVDHGGYRSEEDSGGFTIGSGTFTINDSAPETSSSLFTADELNASPDEPYIPTLDPEQLSVPDTTAPPPQPVMQQPMQYNQYPYNPQANMQAQPAPQAMYGQQMYQPMMQPQLIGYDLNGMPIYAPQPMMQPQLIGYDLNGMPIYAPQPMQNMYAPNGMPQPQQAAPMPNMAMPNGMPQPQPSVPVQPQPGAPMPNMAMPNGIPQPQPSAPVQQQPGAPMPNIAMPNGMPQPQPSAPVQQQPSAPAPNMIMPNGIPQPQPSAPVQQQPSAPAPNMIMPNGIPQPQPSAPVQQQPSAPAPNMAMPNGIPQPQPSAPVQQQQSAPVPNMAMPNGIPQPQPSAPVQQQPSAPVKPAPTVTEKPKEANVVNDDDDDDSDFFSQPKQRNKDMNDVSADSFDFSLLEKPDKKRKTRCMSDVPQVNADELAPNTTDKYNKMFMRSTKVVNADELEENVHIKSRATMNVTDKANADELEEYVKKQPKVSMKTTDTANADDLQKYEHEHVESIMSGADHAVEALPKKKSVNDEIDAIILPDYMQARKTVKSNSGAKSPALPEL